MKHKVYFPPSITGFLIDANELGQLKLIFVVSVCTSSVFYNTCYIEKRQRSPRSNRDDRVSQVQIARDAVGLHEFCSKPRISKPK